MTPPDERPDLPPEQDAVRRLLAEARHDEPVPASVVARLDAALEELTAERREARDPAPVVDLTARRRRRAGAALLAAAAVVVAGIGVGQVVSGAGGDSGSDSGAASTADREAAGGSGTSPESSTDAGAGALSPETSARQAPGGYPAAYRLSSDSLRRDLVAARQAEARAALAGGSSEQPDGGSPEEDSAADSACTAASLPDPGAGTVVPVTLDGRPALALYREPSAGRQRVAVYLCEESVPERTVTLPAP